MKTLKIWRIMFITFAAFSLASCSSDEPDGKWDSMVWKAEVPVQTTDGVYTVLETGTEFTFSCQNYSSPWIEDALTNGEHYYPPREANDYHTITTDWFKAEMSGNKLKVVFEANKTAEDRTLQLTVTAGDIFYTFKFKQFPSDVKGNCQIRYSLYGVSQDLLNFYDINVEYLDANGQQQKEVITENHWLYEPESVSVINAYEEFKCRIVATRKTSIPELTDDYYEIGYGVSSHVSFLNAKGEEFYQLKHSLPSSFTFQTGKTGMQTFLNSTPEIEIENFTSKIDRSEIKERLK